jgi:hypothetical protein
MYDLQRFYQDMAASLLESRSVGWSTAYKLKRVPLLDRSSIHAWQALNAAELMPDLPDLVSYLTDSSKAAQTAQFVRQLQFLVVHNNMDLASVDLLRRCDCMAATTCTVTPSGVASACTGCI